MVHSLEALLFLALCVIDLAFAAPSSVIKNELAGKERRLTAEDFPAGLMPPCEGGAALTTESMSESTYDEISDSVRRQLRALDTMCNNDACPQADWAGCVLRMAGHDFMDFVPNQGGGSDGCVDFNDMDNKGLKPCLVTGEFGKSLSETYIPVCREVSLADFLVIAAEAVMTETREHVGVGLGKQLDFRSSFQFGRTTSETCPSAKGRLPNPENGCAATDQVFNANMGLGWELTAALMAVHTLGRAKTENSGYSGWWADADNSRKFNNNYYISMLSKSWKPVSVADNTMKNQWDRNDVGKASNGGQHEMMLNTDLCLAFEFSGGAVIGAKEALEANRCQCVWLRSPNFGGLDADAWCGGDRGSFTEELGNCCPSGGVSCDSLSNPTGMAIDTVKKYASNEAAWIEDFKKAWAKATTNGFSDLKPLVQTPAMVLALPKGQRCKEGRIGNWGDLGKGASKAECKAACVADAQCKFAVLQTATKSCTSFSECSTTVAKDNVLTWEKVETVAMALALPRGQRCKEGRIGNWGDLGKGVSEVECKSACVADAQCKFAVLQTATKSCTSFSECTTAVTKDNVVTWEKLSPRRLLEGTAEFLV